MQRLRSRASLSDMNNMKRLVVTGLAGQQCRETVYALLKCGRWEVVAITRNPSSEIAQQLRAAGADVVKGDLLNKEELAGHLKGAHGVFAMSNPIDSKGNLITDPEYERNKLNNIIDGCAENGVKHVVFCGAASIFHKAYPTGMASYDVRVEAEQRMQERGLNYTILGLPFFMRELTGPWAPITQDTVHGPVDAECWLPWIAPEDIGSAAAASFGHGELSYGHSHFLVGDMLRGTDAAAHISHVRCCTMTYKVDPEETQKLLGPDAVRLREFFEEKGVHNWPAFKKVLQEALKETEDLIGKVTSFDNWLTKHQFDPRVIPLKAVAVIEEEEEKPSGSGRGSSGNSLQQYGRAAVLPAAVMVGLAAAARFLVGGGGGGARQAGGSKQQQQKGGQEAAGGKKWKGSMGTAVAAA